MSGGYFDYSHFQVEMLAEELKRFVNKQWQFKRGDKVPDLGEGEWDHKLSAKTLQKIEHTANMLYKAANMAHRVDYLLSGDDSEERFHLRWDEEKLDT